MIRFLFLVAIAIGLVVCGSTVKLGKRTFFGHIAAIWETPEAKDMRDGIKKEAGPVVDKVERGVKAGWQEAKKGSGSGSAGSAEKPDPTPAPPPAH